MKSLFKRRIDFIFSILLIFVLSSLAAAQRTRAELVQVTNEQGKTEQVKLYEGSYALVIGESDYTNGWDKLPGVKTDVAAVKGVLEKQGFVVNVVMNPKSKELAAAIDSFIDDHGYIYGNRLLIYFAGHGHTGKTQDGRDMGYIIPSDAPLFNDNNVDFQRKAISMETIQAYAKKIQAKHALFVFDSCFSGKLVNKGGASIPPFILENVEKPVRQFITSGSADQTVPDDSIFRKLFVLGVEGAADEDNDGYILGSELGKYIKRELTNDSKRNQTPQYGEILDVDLKQGDFVFVSEKPKRNPAKSQKVILPEQPARTATFLTTQNITVSAFTKTDICAEAGTRFSITAGGIIYLGEYVQETGPAGKNSFQTFLGVSVPIDKQYYMEQKFPLGALMCRFDYSDNWEYCSVSYTLKAEKKGCLLFEVNDKIKTDNKGAYNVTIKPSQP